VKCRGTLGSFTLDEASQGELAVRLGIGSAGAQYCAHFATPITDAPGRFRAKNAAAPGSCGP
jgi:hypothetical protein